VSKRGSRRQAFTVSDSKRIKWRKLAGRQTVVAQVADFAQAASDVAGQVIGGPKTLVRHWGAKFVPVQAVVCPCLPPGVKFAAQAAFLH